MRSLKAALCMTYILVLGVVNYYVPFSFLFTRFHSYNELYRRVEHSNDMRTKKGKDYFSQMDPRTSLKFYNQQLQKSNILFAIGVVSTKRTSRMDSQKSLGYLYHSAPRIDDFLKNEKLMNNSFAFVCNVDQHPKAHKDAQDIAQFMPYAERFGNTSFRFHQNVNLPDKESFKSIFKSSVVFEKENYDYVFCLNMAAALNPKYILLVEDDAIPHKDFIVVLNYLLKNHLNENSQHYNDFVFIKFYYPSKWQGFSLRFTEIVDLVSFSILGASLYYLLSYCYSLIFHKRQTENINLKDFILWFFISLATCYLIGRQNVNEIRRISPYFYRLQSSEQCCTQAMLFPANIIPRLSQYMVTNAIVEHTDLLIWNFAEDAKLPTYQVEPNVFYHTGLHSTLPNKQKHPQEFLFSDSFLDDMDPKK